MKAFSRGVIVEVWGLRRVWCQVSTRLNALRGRGRMIERLIIVRERSIPSDRLI